MPRLGGRLVLRPVRRSISNGRPLSLGPRPVIATVKALRKVLTHVKAVAKFEPFLAAYWWPKQALSALSQHTANKEEHGRRYEQ